MKPFDKKLKPMFIKKNHPEFNPRLNNLMKLPPKLTFWENLKSFSDQSTFHGLKFVGNGNLCYIERSFFAIAFITSSILSVIFILNVYDKWRLTPVLMSINPTTTFVTEIPFTAITICNMNKALLSEANKIMNNKTTTEYKSLKLLCSNTHLKNGTDTDGYDTSFDYKKFLIKITQSCRKMIKFCRFGNKKKNCSDIFTPVITDAGMCCSFNILTHSMLFKNSEFNDFSSEFPEDLEKAVKWDVESGYPDHLPNDFFPRKSPGIGTKMGLSLTLDAEIDEYYCSSTNTAGFKIAMHNPLELPHVREIGIDVPIGSESRILIEPELYKTSNTIRSLAPSERRCYFNGEYNLTQFGTYTRRNCQIESEAKAMIKHCKCVSYYLPKIDKNISYCDFGQINCLKSIENELQVASNDPECLTACESLYYKHDCIVVPFYFGKYTIKDENLEKLDAAYVKKSISIVNFYLEDNTVHGYIKEQFIGTTEFLSYTGGLMGLFLGFSFISLAEIFYYATLRPFCAYWRYTHHTLQRVNNNNE